MIDKTRRVVCAANKHPNGVLVLGARHWDNTMRNQFDMLALEWNTSHEFEQGFINTWGEFLSRKEAWLVACYNRQIIRYVGNQVSSDFGLDDVDLYSENLY